MDNSAELNYILAKDILEIKLQAYTDENISPFGAWIDPDSKAAKDIITSVVKATVCLELKDWDKGIIYAADHDGWHIEYKLPASEAYFAKAHVVMEGDVECWLTRDLHITVAPVPDYCHSWLTCFLGWKQYKEKFRQHSLTLMLVNKPNKEWTAEISNGTGEIAACCAGETPELALARAMIAFNAARKASKPKALEPYEHYQSCPHCKASFSFRKPSLDGFCTWCLKHLTKGNLIQFPGPKEPEAA